MTNMSAFDKQARDRQVRRSWQAPSLKPVGTIAEVLQGGGGKQSVVEADMGDFNKPKGQS
jgi:hypothetical protein